MFISNTFVGIMVITVTKMQISWHEMELIRFSKLFFNHSFIAYNIVAMAAITNAKMT